MTAIEPIRRKKEAPEALKIKSYYAQTVEEALARASEEMGPDAILVHSRKTPLESRHLGPYEVVFAHHGGERPVPPAQDAASPRPVPAATAMDPGATPISVELLNLRRQMEEIRRSLAIRSMPARPETPAAVDNARSLLCEAEVDETIVEAVVDASARDLNALAYRLASNGETLCGETLWEALREPLTARLPSAPAWPERGRTAPVVAFAGPPGAGKTTALVKMAASLSERATRPIHIISADTARVGAAGQLQVFAAILGATLDVADSPTLIEQSIAANLHREMILIDTPGLSGPDFELLDELAGFLAGRDDITTHLVLPATPRCRDLKRMLRRYEAFRAGRLLFTHLDETDCFGPLYSAAAWSGVPVSFLAAGQQIPEDLEPASPERIVEMLLHGAAGGRS